MRNQSSHFEEILLPPIILAGLYANNLVIIEPSSSSLKKEDKEIITPESKTYLPSVGIVMQVAESRELSLKEPGIENVISWFGGFKKNILVVVSDEHSVHVGDNELELLSKMLGALKLSVADIAIVNCCKNNISWPSLIEELPAKQVIFFGVDPLSIDVPIRLPHFRVHRWNDTGFLYSPSLATINTLSAEQTTLKKELWKALQELFPGG